jgi:hypothetical protein
MTAKFEISTMVKATGTGNSIQEGAVGRITLSLYWDMHDSGYQGFVYNIMDDEGNVTHAIKEEHLEGVA